MADSVTLQFGTTIVPLARGGSQHRRTRLQPRRPYLTLCRRLRFWQPCLDRRRRSDQLTATRGKMV